MSCPGIITTKAKCGLLLLLLLVSVLLAYAPSQALCAALNTNTEDDPSATVSNVHFASRMLRVNSNVHLETNDEEKDIGTEELTFGEQTLFRFTANLMITNDDIKSEAEKLPVSLLRSEELVLRTDVYLAPDFEQTRVASSSSPKHPSCFASVALHIRRDFSDASFSLDTRQRRYNHTLFTFQMVATFSGVPGQNITTQVWNVDENQSVSEWSKTDYTVTMDWEKDLGLSSSLNNYLNTHEGCLRLYKQTDTEEVTVASKAMHLRAAEEWGEHKQMDVIESVDLGKVRVPRESFNMNVATYFRYHDSHNNDGNTGSAGMFYSFDRIPHQVTIAILAGISLLIL